MAVRIQVTEYYIQLLVDNTNDASFLHLLSRVKGIFAMRARNTYRCSLSLLPEILAELRGITSEEQLSGSILSFYRAEMQRRISNESLKLNGPVETDDKLWVHQMLGVELARINKRYNFFYDTRTGKTPMSLRIMYEALASGEAKRCLVICPAAIMKDWLKDAGDWYPMLKTVTFYGDEKDKMRALTTPCHIAFWSTSMVDTYSDLIKKLNFDICFFDESSKAKNYRSKTAQAIFDISMTIPRWYNLSATPAPNGEHEYYIQMRTVDPYAFNPTRGHFVSRYFDNNSRNRNYEKLVIKPDMKAEFMDTVEKYSLYVDQGVMPTAGKDWVPVYFDMTNEEKELYKTMHDDMYAEVDGHMLTASMSAAMRAKLNQITRGFILDTEAIKENKYARLLKEPAVAKECYRVTSDKRAGCSSILKLRELLASKCRGEQVVIWAYYSEEFAMLNELFGTDAVYIKGGCSAEDKWGRIAAFKSRRVQYLVAHPLSIGMGINLTEAHIAIYYSLNDSWEAFKQSSERIYGHISVQPKRCQYYILMANETVNEIIYKNVSEKRDASTGFLEHLRCEVFT